MTDKRKRPPRRNANPVRIRPIEIRLARQMLGWSRLQLARQAAVPFPELSAFERRGAWIDGDSLRRIERTLECAGVAFVGAPVFPGLVACRADRVGVIVRFGVPRARMRGRR